MGGGEGFAFAREKKTRLKNAYTSSHPRKKLQKWTFWTREMDVISFFFFFLQNWIFLPSNENWQSATKELKISF